MANSPLDSGGLPPVPHQVLLDAATLELAVTFRKCGDALTRAADNVEQACYNASAREYIGRQLGIAKDCINHLQGILVEHGCTVDLDEPDAQLDADIEDFLTGIGLPKPAEGGAA